MSGISGETSLTTRERIYEAALRAARVLLRPVESVGSRVHRGMQGRRDALPALERWAAAHRDPERPLVWLHAPSVGEGLMAGAIAGALRRERPGVQIVFTHFSTSAEQLGSRLEVDVSAYLPWDTRADAARAIDAVRPDAIAFVRTEIWPVLAAVAADRGVPLALVNAVVSESSRRMRAPAKFLLGPAYRRLNVLGAITREDADRFVDLGVRPERVRVTGDARFDQVVERVQRTSSTSSPLLERLQGADRPTLVAGSTWPVDEERLVPAVSEPVRKDRLRLIIAPHEPSEEHLATLEGTLTAARLPHRRLAEFEGAAAAAGSDDDGASVIIVDRTGVLADLYALAEIAYVGGGFHGAGLHSVVEPAAYGVPVIFGPHHGNAREAADLVREGAGIEVAGIPLLEERVRELLEDDAGRRTVGERAAAYVRSRLGGAAANAALTMELLDGGGAAGSGTDG